MNGNTTYRHATVHRMTRWPVWKDSHMPGTYMVTIKVNGDRQILGKLSGNCDTVYQWLYAHPEQAQSANADSLYYRHALLGTIAMPFVLKETQAAETQAVKTAAHKDSGDYSLQSGRQSLQGGGLSLQGGGLSLQGGYSLQGGGYSLQGGSLQSGRQLLQSGPSLQGGGSCPLSSCDGVSTPSSATGLHGKARTHFPLETLRQPTAPHIVLSPLGSKVKECLERMPEVVQQLQLICYAIMPNHLHFIIAVREPLPRSIGSVIRSFMGTTTHRLHEMLKTGDIHLNTLPAMSMDKASTDKPPLWTKGYCLSVCQTEQRLHTCIGYVLENPFFGILEKEQSFFMDRSACLSIAGRRYDSYGNIFLLKEPERIQVFCHRRHPETGEPYEQTKDFREEKAALLEASASGAVIVTPAISPGEVNIMWAVLKAGGRVINIQQPVADNKKWHPEKERRLYCSRGQLLVLAVSTMPDEVLHDRNGDIIPSDTKYARFHLLNEVAREICAEGTEHQCSIKRRTP